MTIIRDAVSADCPGIARVQVDSYRSAYAGLFPPAYLAQFSYTEQEQDWENWFASGGSEILLVALSPENQVEGYILARAQPEVFPGFDAEIAALHVRQAARGRGVGRALLSQAAVALAARGCRSVMLWTLQGNPVRHWYVRLNGQLLGEKSFEVDGWLITEVAYGWEDILVLS